MTNSPRHDFTVLYGDLNAQQLSDNFAAAIANGTTIKDEDETLLVVSSSSTQKKSWWKLYRIPTLRRCFAWLARSRASRGGTALLRFKQLNIPAVKVVAIAERRSFFGLTASLLLTEDCPAASDLRAHLRNPQLSEQTRSQLLQMAGRAARHLHDQGIVHFRMQLRNLLALEPDHSPCWLDAPYACDYRKPLPSNLRAVDLVDLVGRQSVASLEDASTLLLAYAGSDQPPIRLNVLRARSKRSQKFRRIAGYLIAINTGKRIRLKT